MKPKTARTPLIHINRFFFRQCVSRHTLLRPDHMVLDLVHFDNVHLNAHQPFKNQYEESRAEREHHAMMIFVLELQSYQV